MRNARLLALVALIAPACGGTRVTVPRVAPAEVNLAGYKRLAIGGIGGVEGDKLVVDLTAALVQTQRFDVLDRQHLAEVMKEQDFGASGRVSDDTAVSIGQLIGSATLVVGDVTARDYKEEVTTSKRQCIKDNKTVECIDHTRTASAQLAVALKVIDTESGKILAAKNLASSAQKSAVAEDAPPAELHAADELFTGIRQTLVGQFVKVIAPYQFDAVVELLDDGDLPELERGNNYAKVGNWREAIGQYQAAVDKAEKPDFDAGPRAKAHYDLGVAYGYSGSYEAGVKELETAFSLDPDDRFSAQIGVIKQFRVDDARLAEQQAGATEAAK